MTFPANPTAHSTRPARAPETNTQAEARKVRIPLPHVVFPGGAIVPVTEGFFARLDAAKQAVGCHPDTGSFWRAVAAEMMKAEGMG